MQYSITFPAGTVQYIFGSFAGLSSLHSPESCILLIDRKVAELHPALFSAYRHILIDAGETCKTLETVSDIAAQLLKLEAHRGTTLVGVGGGITTDICGFVAATYMRGLRFGFVPTTLLAMADAAIGGKNGVNFGLQKNLLGTIRQPEFILFDSAILSSLPNVEWSNGFAEVIKYACLFDADLFNELEQYSIEHYKTDTAALTTLIQRCVAWKNKIVLGDEQENGQRKLLNFGHTAGHAIETVHSLPHGYAIAIGMLVACRLSELHTALHESFAPKLTKVLQRYGLPTSLNLDVARLMDVLKMDKKRSADTISYILLEDLAKPMIKDLKLDAIRDAIENYSYAGTH